MNEINDTPAQLIIENVQAGYNGKPVLENLTFRVPHGGQVAVVGPNGAGKSTLFKVLVGLLPVKMGRILIHNRPLGSHQDCVAYVPQREEVDFQFPVTVMDVVMMGRFGRRGWLSRLTSEDNRIVMSSLDRMGISNLAQTRLSDLSGGQQQRVFLARALAQQPHILLMDEPFTGVDASAQEAVLELLDDLQKQQVTVMLSTHDLNLAAQRFDTVLLLNHRVVAYGAPSGVFTPENIRSAFSGQVLMLENNAIVVDQCCPADEHQHHKHEV